jgi:beta-galactosidase/beta-glucuronidase
MNRKIILLATVFISVAIRGLSQEKTFIVPATVAGVKQHVISLNGTWQFKFSPESKWATIVVPGEAAMQGYAIEHDRPFRYRKSFTLPADYRGKTVILRFDGVYSHARLWVNDVPVREHHGGFTRWETDVTSLVKTGGKNIIELEVTDRIDEISYASGYAHHPIGGILRDVSVFALPEVHIHDFHAETRLDTQYRDAVLRLRCIADSGDGGEIEYALIAPDGEAVALAQDRFPIVANEVGIHDLPVKEPLKWDAEHPNLYTLSVTVLNDGKETYRFNRKIGFRDVRILKNRMLVNGKPVKLRGACRHDMHPTMGRSTTNELDSLDAAMFKQANMNFVRTSHYPCSEKFLDYCDRLGIYVECETAVCFISTHGNKNYASINTQDNPEYTDRYLTQLREMVNTFRSHPSVILWSLGNESVYGDNFAKCREWISGADSTRPSIFSYPGTQKKDKRIFDILSMHYPALHGNLSQMGASVSGFQASGTPALFDEWAHVPCYTNATLRDDPNIREFWGISLDKMWENIFETSGALGGAIWGYVDETFMLPRPKTGTQWWKTFSGRGRDDKEYAGNCVGYGEWGIVDVWRRVKPEFWATRKAYSPIRLTESRITRFTAGERLTLVVHNRFDHTDMNEIAISYKYNGVEKAANRISVAPHKWGTLTVPAEEWREGERLILAFRNGNNETIDEHTITLGHEKIYNPNVPHEATPLKTEENDSTFTVIGKNFKVRFDKATGLIARAESHGETVMGQGPFLHLDVNGKTLPATQWNKTNFRHDEHSDRVSIFISGNYGKLAVDFTIYVFPDGQMSAIYEADSEQRSALREAGLAFYMPDEISRAKWKRKGYWDDYPDESLAGNEDAISLYGERQADYGKQPEQPWRLDTHNYYYYGDRGANCNRPLTQQAKGLKENCYRYALATENGRGIVSAWSPDASIACRVSRTADDRLVLYVDNLWDYPEIGWGNHTKNLNTPPCYGRFTFCFEQ